jgi:hypothetical protein
MAMAIPLLGADAQFSHGGADRARWAATVSARMRQDSAMAKGARKRESADGEIDRLFELPPEEFTAARDELAKRVAGEGRAEQSRAVKALRRPTVAAWAVNQLVRRRPRDIDDLLEAGASLRRAQRKVLSGIRSADFREASERRRRLVTGLVRMAEEILRESGRASAGAGEAVRSTLEAASLDDQSGEMIRAGRLSKELPPPSSFGAVEGLGLVPAPTEEPPAPAKPRTKRGAGKEEKEKEEARALRAQQDQAAREAKGLVEKAAQARRAAIRAREQADRANSRADRLRQEAEKARVEARDAAKKAQQAEAEATRAQDAADRAARRAEKLSTT